MKFYTISLLLSIFGAIAVVSCVRFDDSNNYGSFIKSVCKKYSCGGVIIGFTTEHQSFQRTSIWYATSRILFDNGVAVLFLNYEEVKKKLNAHVARMNRLLVILVIDNTDAIYDLESMIRNLNMGKATWMMLFRRDTGATSNWTGLIGRVYRNEADIGVADVLMLPERHKAVYFSVPMITGAYHVYFKKLEQSNVSWNAYFKVFTVGVWLTIIGLILTMPILLTVMQINIKKHDLFSRFCEEYLCIWGIFCQQGWIDFANETPVQILQLSISLTALLIYIVYATLMTSVIAVSSSFRPFTTLEGFVADGTYKFIVLNESIFYNRYKRSNETLFKGMMSLMKPRHLLPTTYPEGFKQVCNERVGFYANEIAMKFYRHSLSCNTISITAGPQETMALILPKGSDLINIVNYYIQRFKYNGMLRRLEKKYTGSSEPEISHHSPVHLQEITPVVFVLFVGIIVTSIIFAFEILYFCRKIRQRRSINERIRISIRIKL
ncbi:glutamate receptor-like [Fopius arisanus]|uniref:Glutamate receptor-like n=1 Tax=Fopius arisanus TaxID=64838 RepID=A0A9R1TGP0_9HYME|nr:PREDICTED: glutamate receptor-like [Fopius arisanus]